MYFRFGKIEDQKDALRLYTVQIPHKRDRKPPPCYLTKWDGKSFLPMLTAPCGAEVISSMAVRYTSGSYDNMADHCRGQWKCLCYRIYSEYSFKS